MKILILMSNLENNNLQASNDKPKSLVEIEGKPIVEHVLSLFPGEKDENFIFVCLEDHLNNSNMKHIISSLKPRSITVSHNENNFLSFERTLDYINNNEPIIICNCDFYQVWDYKDFIAETIKNQFAATIIQSKDSTPNFFSVTNDKINQQSGSVLYLNKGEYLKKYIQKLTNNSSVLDPLYNIHSIFKLMDNDGLIVSKYQKISNYCLWRSQENINNYNSWSEIFKKMTRKKEIIQHDDLINLIPMAGEGSRFKTEGYTVPKPLINVSKKHMIFQASDFLPQTKNWIYVCREEHIDNFEIDIKLKDYNENVEVISINKLTEGQASTCLLTKSLINNDKELIIAASDNGIIWDEKKYLKLKESCDCLVWTFRNSEAVVEKPEGYGWVVVKEDGITVEKMSVKVPISNTPINDHAVVGVFWFKNGNIFVDAAEKMINDNIRINNEFYVDEAINQVIELGYKVKVMEVDKFICWGTPDDLKTFEYWQNFFDDVDFHTYSKSADIYYG